MTEQLQEMLTLLPERYRQSDVDAFKVSGPFYEKIRAQFHRAEKLEGFDGMLGIKIFVSELMPRNLVASMKWNRERGMYDVVKVFQVNF